MSTGKYSSNRPYSSTNAGNMFNAEFKVVATKTYATVENARKAVVKAGFNDVRHFMMTNAEGRFFPVFVGNSAMDRGVHFHFNVIG